MNASGGVRVLVTGERDYADRDFVFATLDKLSFSCSIACIIEGGARGADRLAREWAVARGVAVETYPADWDTNGRAAGPIRNRKMLATGRPGLAVAFPGGRGTADMIGAAKAAGVEVIEPRKEASP